jgi:uncharacterized caspase-like protein
MRACLAIFLGIVVCGCTSSQSLKKRPPVQPRAQTPVELDAAVKRDALLGKKYALIIGISSYKEFNDLPLAANDAAKIAEIAAQKGYDRVIVLLNEQATREGIRKAMDEMRVDLKKDDLFSLFFAGHGQRQHDAKGEFSGYLIHHECRKKNVAEDAFPINAMSETIAQMPNKYIMLLIDACYSGSLTDRVAAASKKGALKDHHVRIFTSADEDEWAFEGDEHGLFTQHLLKQRAVKAKGVAGADEASRMARNIVRGVKNETGGWQNPRFVEVGRHALEVKERSY